jgi:hypothetical protein
MISAQTRFAFVVRKEKPVFVDRVVAGSACFSGYALKKARAAQARAFFCHMACPCRNAANLSSRISS